MSNLNMTFRINIHNEDGRYAEIIYAAPSWLKTLFIHYNRAALHSIINNDSGRINDMDDTQIKHMVDRFLQWKLPADFNPDGGVSYAPISYHTLIGTNLFTATQAREMVKFMLAEMPKESHQ